jgi:4-amino-4-deoxy-L-arabinose transferase-like glycosyltransferase
MILGRNFLYSFIIIILATIPAIYKLNTTPLNNYDEARRAVNAYEMLQNENYLVTHYDGSPDMWGTKPALLVNLQVLSMKLIGVNKTAVRLPSILFTIALFILIIYFSSRLEYIKWGWLAVLMLATSTGFINSHGARSGDYEAMLCFWTTMIIFFYYTYLNATNNDQRNYYFFIVTLSLILACLTKGIAGLLILPGLFIYTLLERKLPSVLQDWRLWAGVFLFLGIIGGYYMLRNHYNPGYLAKVWENEIGGRYNQSLEGHQAPFYYYFLLLFQTYFMPWILFLPLLIRVWKQRPKWFSYLFITSLSFILVISSSKTKISWYLYPSLPLLALLAAPCLIAVKDFFIRKLQKISKNQRHLSTGIFVVLLFIIPFYLILQRVDKRIENDLRHGAIAYGTFIEKHPDLIDSIHITSIGYNPHVLFHTYQLQASGKHVWRVAPNPTVVKGGIILICEEEGLNLFNKQYEVVKKSDHCQLIKLGRRLSIHPRKN